MKENDSIKIVNGERLSDTKVFINGRNMANHINELSYNISAGSLPEITIKFIGIPVEIINGKNNIVRETLDEKGLKRIAMVLETINEGKNLNEKV